MSLKLASVSSREVASSTVSQEKSCRNNCIRMKSILIDVRGSETFLKALKAVPGIKVTLCEPVSEEARTLPLELVRDQHILFCSRLPENFEQMKQLEWVQLCSAGY